MLAIEQGWWGPVGKFVKKVVVEPVVKVVKVVVDWVGDAVKAAVSFFKNVVRASHSVQMLMSIWQLPACIAIVDRMGVAAKGGAC